MRWLCVPPRQPCAVSRRFAAAAVVPACARARVRGHRKHGPKLAPAADLRVAAVQFPRFSVTGGRTVILGRCRRLAVVYPVGNRLTQRGRATAAMARHVTIQIVSDIICPWCFVGKRRLESALRAVATAGITATVVWRPFFLDSSLPVEGCDRRERYVKKFGEARVAAMLPAMARTGTAEGIHFTFEGKTANTMRAHRLMSWMCVVEHLRFCGALPSRCDGLHTRAASSATEPRCRTRRWSASFKCISSGASRQATSMGCARR